MTIQPGIPPQRCGAVRVRCRLWAEQGRAQRFSLPGRACRCPRSGPANTSPDSPASPVWHAATPRTASRSCPVATEAVGCCCCGAAGAGDPLRGEGAARGELFVPDRTPGGLAENPAPPRLFQKAFWPLGCREVFMVGTSLLQQSAEPGSAASAAAGPAGAAERSAAQRCPLVPAGAAPARPDPAARSTAGAAAATASWQEKFCPGGGGKRHDCAYVRL